MRFSTHHFALLSSLHDFTWLMSFPSQQYTKIRRERWVPLMHLSNLTFWFPFSAYVIILYLSSSQSECIRRRTSTRLHFANFILCAIWCYRKHMKLNSKREEVSNHLGSLLRNSLTLNLLKSRSHDNEVADLQRH